MRIVADWIEGCVIFQPFAMPESILKRFLQMIDCLVAKTSERIVTSDVVQDRRIIRIDCESSAAAFERFVSPAESN